jgi:integrase
VAWIRKRESTKKGGAPSYNVLWRDPSGSVRSKTFTRSRDARRFKEELDRSKGGVYRDPTRGQRITVAAAFERFLEQEPPLAAETKRSYQHVWNNHLADTDLVALPVVAVSRVDHIEPTLKVIESDSVRKKARYMLSGLFGQCVALEELEQNPAKGGRASKTRSAKLEARANGDGAMRRFALSEEQLVGLVNEIEPRYRAMVLVMARGGLRPGEAMALRVGDLDFAKGIIRVERSIAGETKTGVVRRVAMTADLREALRDHLAKHVSDASEPAAVLFAGPRGAAPDPDNFRDRLFRPAAQRASLPDRTTPHALRHTFATRAVDLGISVADVAAALGDTIAVTAHSYVHANDDAIRKIARALDDAAEGRHVCAVCRTAVADHDCSKCGASFDAHDCPVASNVKPLKAAK